MKRPGFFGLFFWEAQKQKKTDTLLQDDIFFGRDMLQELSFFLVLLTAGLGRAPGWPLVVLKG